MKQKIFKVIIGLCAFSMIAFIFSADSFAKKRIVFGGGPAGGTFQVVANGIQVYKPVKAIEEFKPDILHVHHVSLITWIAYYIKNLANVKYIVTTHGSCLHNISLDRRYFSLTADALKGAKMITRPSLISNTFFVISSIDCPVIKTLCVGHIGFPIRA